MSNQDASGLIPYGTISLEAFTDPANAVFTDPASIQADSVRVYNSGIVEVFVGTSDIPGQKASVFIPGKSESSNATPVGPKDSVTIYKGAGIDNVAVITAGGKSHVRFTAIKNSQSGGDMLGSLQLISVLSDAMNDQKKIDQAVKKISDAYAISDDRKQEAKEAAKTIEEAKALSASLKSAKIKHETEVSAHLENISRFNAYVEEENSKIKQDRDKANKEIDDRLSAIAQAQSEADDKHKSAERLIGIANEKEKALEGERVAFGAEKLAHEEADKALVDARNQHDEDVASFEARKKSIEDALKGK